MAGSPMDQETPPAEESTAVDGTEVSENGSHNGASENGAQVATAPPARGGGGTRPGMMRGGGGGGGGGMGMGGGMGVGGGISLKNLRTFSSFKNPVYRLFYGAMLGQMAAMNMQMMARSFLIYHLTGSYVALGVMALANSVPQLFFSLFGGVIADRAEKKYVLMVGQSASAMVAMARGVRWY